MPDLLAGTVITGTDTPATVADTENAIVGSITSTTFAAQTSGSAICGVAFTAPTSGRVQLHYSADLDHDNAARSTVVSPHVRTGSSVNSGTDVQVASDDTCIANLGTSQGTWGRTMLISGLTAGSSYNVVLEHRVTGGGNGQVARRHVIAQPVS